MPLSIKICVSITVAILASVGTNMVRPVTTDARLKTEWFWAMKTHDTDDVDLIIYGDSRVSQAVDTRPLQTLFPDVTARNLGYAGAGFNPEMYTHLRRIAEGKESRMIILLGITPYGLTTEAAANEQFREEWRRPKSEVLLRLRLYPLLSVFEPVAPSMFRNARSQSGMYITHHADGWEEAYELPENPGKWLPIFRRHFQRTQVDPRNLQATYTFIRDCRRDGIPVYGFRPPSCRQMEQIEDDHSGFEEASFIRDFEAAGGTWLDVADRFAYYSYDGSHLHYKAAKEFSRDLAAAIRATIP